MGAADILSPGGLATIAAVAYLAYQLWPFLRRTIILSKVPSPPVSSWILGNFDLIVSHVITPSADGC